MRILRKENRERPAILENLYGSCILRGVQMMLDNNDGCGCVVLFILTFMPIILGIMWLFSKIGCVLC